MVKKLGQGLGWTGPTGLQNPHLVVKDLVREEPQWGSLDYEVQGLLLVVFRHGESRGHPAGAA